MTTGPKSGAVVFRGRLVRWRGLRTNGPPALCLQVVYFSVRSGESAAAGEYTQWGLHICVTMGHTG
jgi:hypothetical protein